MGETETYIKRIKGTKNSAEETLDKIKRDKIDEYATAKTELEIAKLKAEIKEIESKGQPIQPQQAQGLVSAIIAQNFADPKRAQEFLSSLDEESLNKLALLLAADNPRAEALTNLMRSPTSDVKSLVEILKLMRPENGGMDLKGIADLLKVGIEMGKASNPQPQSMQEATSFILGIMKPFQDSLNIAQQEAFKANLEAIKAQIPPPLEAQITNLKAMADKLGLSGSGSEKITEINLKLEDMRQSHDIEMEKVRWEKEKYLLGKESDTEKWDKIAGMFNPIFQMPEIRDAIRNIGASVGKGIAGATNPNVPNQPQIVGFVCPSCNAELSVPLPSNAPEEVPIKCPKCGVITPAKLSQQSQAQTPPPEEKPTSNRLKATYT